MARIDATAAKAAAALAAVQLTTILGDDTLTELFNDYKENHHPMRGTDKLFLLDPATGIVTSNDAYIDAAYAGNFPTSGIDSGRQSQGTPTPITLVSAIIADASPGVITLTFSEGVYDRQEMWTAIAGVGAAGRTLTSIKASGESIVATYSPIFEAGGVVTISGRFFGNRGYIDLTDEAVTNSIA